MKKFTTLNIFFGWLIFGIAAVVYLSTIEPSASFWDCGEFIAASFKLEVGHPPGAPFFLLVGRLFSLLAGPNVEKVPVMINSLSALASAFTILFLFWTITHLTKKILAKNNEPSITDSIIIIGSGIVGALAYTFSDTFWFSAVEGEVYASSSLFTAVVFWSILKWENIADEKYANRWLILIAYLMGLSIGVHLLNLLAIPAIVFIYYFKNYNVSRKGVILALILGASILGAIMYILIPGFVKVAGLFERIFVNGFGMPYWSGVIVYCLLITALIIYGLYFTHKYNRVIINTAILIVTVILIGYSSYALVVIRSAANPPMDQNNPENIFSLLSYLNREQYGERPLLYGQYFNAQAKSSKETSAVYAPEDGKYKIINHKFKYIYGPSYSTVFPRMYSSQEDHIDAYLKWTGLKESDFFEVRKDKQGNPVRDRFGETVYDHNSPLKKPPFSANIRFFIRYQLGHMYFRYFMWNFSGRQNDIQSHFKEEIKKGNWITGLKFLDSPRLGNQNKVPDSLMTNKARNTYYLLPLILGLIGMFFQYKHDKNNFWVVMFLFILTGIAIVIYLNQYPIQPRERDYAYAGSFYAFTIWIGLAVVALYKAAKESDVKSLSKYSLRGGITILIIGIIDLISNGALTFTWAAVFVFFIILVLLFIMHLAGSVSKNGIVFASLSLALTLPVPIIMGLENWDDHDRSDRYFARDFAANYLNSCEQNAILYTNGDNDTFPLWYAQEVEGIRTDIRVINMSYLSADWYIEQMEHKAYGSDPVKMTLNKGQYKQGTRDIVYFVDRVNGFVDLKEAIKFLADDSPATKSVPGTSEKIDYLPQHKFKVGADSVKVFKNGTINEFNKPNYTPSMVWEIKRRYVLKNHLMALDFLASNEWDRPICYAITVSNDNYLDMQNYFEMHGLAYRVVPSVVKDDISYLGGINPDITFENMIRNFKWGGIENDNIYLDENINRMLSNMRFNFGNLASALILKEKPDSAKIVLDRCVELMPNDKVPYDLYMLGIVEGYYKIGDKVKAEEVADTILMNTYQDIEYMLSLEDSFSSYLSYEKRLSMHILSELIRIAKENDDRTFSAEIEQNYETYGTALSRKM